ncbi:DNA damage-inducible protein F [Planktothrix tepida]|uniref:Probable multidrug resistance protein NorM n=2 Tax=Planktothrix TaxID=54304 RepID=A0A1J1LR96_9CYAN|nr:MULTISPECIES: guanitoxin biosynthesis MATE family efflux transporter GntT [Planktothrix]CAD5944130.1 DNA damage-inducible protein F [Planktothrix pseudagardhii]CAD5966693.1 DNA damage-inducible protein F [Planktothrix tepida]CUR35085.1 putative efflux protein, MATE family [Planktothrix tepida PCC 9214]
MNLKLPIEYDFVSRFFRLAIANVLSCIMMPLANLISTIFLGHLEEIDHLAGVALAGNLFSFIYFILLFLRMGTTGVTAQAVGRDEREAVLLVGLRNGLIALALGITLLLLQYPLGQLAFALLNVTPEIKASALAYFNANIWAAPANLLNFVLMGWFLGQEKNGLVILLSVVGNIAKVAFDYLLIVHWGWESMGAGISSATSQYLSLLVGLIFVCKDIQWQEVQAITGKIWNISAIKSTLTLNGNILISNFFFIFSALVFNYEGAQMGTMIYAENTLLLQIINLNVYLVSGLGFGTETLVGNFKGKGASQQLLPLVSVSLSSALLVALSLGGVCWLYPDTVFGLLTNHRELIENINIYIPWLLGLLLCDSINFMLDAYFLGLAEGRTLRNVSLAAIMGFLPLAFVAIKFESNQILWLASCIFLVIRIVMLGVKLPQTFVSDIEEGGVSIPAIETSHNLTF